MPAIRAKCKSRKCLNDAVSANMHNLAHSKTKRPQKQMVAIAFSEARGKSKFKFKK